MQDEDVKSHPLFKNMQSQVETCRGINVQLSTKMTRLEETVRILETKNLYQQEELQKVKGINEGMQNSKKDPNPPFCPPSNCYCSIYVTCIIMQKLGPKLGFCYDLLSI